MIPSNSKRRRGMVATLVCLVLVTLLGLTALAVDGGLMQDSKRRVQAAADAAALAAATKLYQNYNAITTSNPDPGGGAVSAAQTSAATNGFANTGKVIAVNDDGSPSNGTGSVVTVNIPPKSGPFTGMLDYAEVIITYFQPRYFSTVYGTQKIPITARAVARGKSGGSGDGVIVLDPTAQYSLDAGGNGGVTVTGGARMIVDSNNAAAARTQGGGSLTASAFDVTGGTVGTFNGPVYTGVPPIPDPLAYLPQPTQPRNGTMTKKNIPGGGTHYFLTPGTYNNLPNFTNGDVVTFQQASAGNGGIYYINGGFVSNGANLIMDSTTSGGMMIYNNPTNSSNSQGISIAGNSTGTVILSALSNGPYAGILFWQNRTAGQTMSVTGNGVFSLTGTFYLANAQLSVTGNGNATIGSQYISRFLYLGGGGNTLINYTDKGTARVRIITLVE